MCAGIVTMPPRHLTVVLFITFGIKQRFCRSREKVKKRIVPTTFSSCGNNVGISIQEPGNLILPKMIYCCTMLYGFKIYQQKFQRATLKLA